MFDSGLPRGTIEEIIRVVSTRPFVRELLLFGSRAKGTYRPGSDVDLALKGSGLGREDVVAVSQALNEEGLQPYHFDIVLFETIENPELKEQIERVGIPLYSAPERTPA